MKIMHLENQIYFKLANRVYKKLDYKNKGNRCEDAVTGEIFRIPLMDDIDEVVDAPTKNEQSPEPPKPKKKLKVITEEPKDKDKDVSKPESDSL